jgi:putative transposase
MLDGVRIGKTHAVAAIGIDRSGHKHVLGWSLGSTENHVVCRDLIRHLVESGLDVNAPYLFVLDGSKALCLAVKETFGDNSVIQRCQEHKIRDVEGYLNAKQAKLFRIKIQTAYNEPTYQAASKRLQKIRWELLSVSEKAANSLTEGLESTLTLHRLGIAGGVRESLRTTNIIESSFSRLRQYIRNVTNWSDHEHIDRWLAFGLLKVEDGYRQLPGYRQLARLSKMVAKEHAALQQPKH